MKKIFSIVLILLFCTGNCYAKTPKPEPTKVNYTFLYINGSNNNDEKMKNWYINGVNNLHPAMKRKFEKNFFIKKQFRDSKLVIDEKPNIFFWGYDSKTDLEYVKERLDISKAFSSTIAYEVRSLLTQFLHDAIWVQKDHNMLPILDDLNDEVKKLAENNQNVVLFGYSAGAFVTLQYTTYKMRYINLKNIFEELKTSEDFLKFVEENPRKNTCISALMHDKGNIGVFANNGHLVLNQNEQLLRENYLKIDEATELYCAPEKNVKAIINFASPIPLFYSDLGDENYELNYYGRYLIKYILENGIYFLTVNFKEDPLAFPTSNNYTIQQIEELLEMKIENPTGVIYDNSKVWSMRSALLAHTSYWSAKKIFSRNVVKTFVNGNQYLYNTKYQQKVRKRKKDPEAVY